jgi:hypothetical protein
VEYRHEQEARDQRDKKRGIAKSLAMPMGEIG